jgi:hypothetical protein
MRHHRILAGLLLLFLSLASAGLGQTNGKAPISKKGLVDALHIGALSTSELVAIVQQRGVDFQVNAEDETELRQAGAQPALVEAARKNYRAVAPAPAQATSHTPLSKDGVITLLQVGTPTGRLEELLNARGVNFEVTPVVSRELQVAGASSSLIMLIDRLSRSMPPSVVASAPPPSKVPADTVQSIRDVHKIYVESMPGGLDSYIRTEIGEQLKGRWIVALNRDDADAIMKGATENRSSIVRVVDRTGRLELWSSEAGDRTMLGPLKHGGPRKVAERIVHKLHEALRK